MKSFALSAAVAALLFAAPAAMAQDHHDKGHGGDHAGTAHQGGGHNGGVPHAAPAAPHAAPAAPAAAPAAHVGHNGGSHAAASPVIPPHQHISPGKTTTTASPADVYRKAVQDATVRNQRARDTNRHDSNGGHNNNDRTGNNRNSNNNDRNGNWNNGGSHNDNHNNFGNNNNNRSNANGRANFNRRNVTAQHHYRYRGGAYRGPSGYSYRRWTFGMVLPSVYWGRNYWVSDYSDYGLAYPPPGCVWVRYGNDAILVDQDSGDILEVVYGQFY